MSVSGNVYIVKHAGLLSLLGKALSKPELTGSLLGIGMGGLGGYLTGNSENPWLRSAIFGGLGGLAGRFGGRIIRDGVIDNLKVKGFKNKAALGALKAMPTRLRDKALASL